MRQTLRVPITNRFKDGQFAAPIRVGPAQKPLNLLLDTGSGPLVVDGAKYTPDIAGGDLTTHQAQTVGYADGGGWTGALIETQVSIGQGIVGAARLTLAVAYQASPNVFGTADGVLGLAYAPLDSAFTLPADTWKSKYPPARVAKGAAVRLAPGLDQLAQAGVVIDQVAFLIRRSMIRAGAAADPLNNGWLVLGDGEACADLYVGPFTAAKVVADAWCNTQLKAVVVGDGPPISAPPQGPAPSPSNSAVDTGNPTLVFAPLMLQEILTRFSASQQALLNASLAGGLVAAADLDLGVWPDILLILEGEGGADMRLSIAPSNYWQIDSPAVGQAKAAITAGIPDLTILGLPVMSGRFTIFDRTPGRGTIRFAAAR
jgi:hypothetical protein